MPNKVNQKGASCYTNSQYRNPHMPQSGKYIKKTKNDWQKQHLYKI